MAKNVVYMGAVFSDTPAIKLPTQEGPMAQFDDTTDATAVAADIAQGKTAYVNGQKVVGTNQGGGGGGGGGTIKPNARLVLIDYDGSIVDSYTQSEIDALSALPANPDHSGDEIPLTSQGWNWTLAEVREQLAAMPEQTVYVGQMYVPTDGKTHIVIYIDPSTPSAQRNMTVRFIQSADNGVRVDWGDGSPAQTYTGTSVADRTHTYTGTGWFDITFEVTSGALSFLGTTATTGYSIYGQRTDGLFYMQNRVRHIRFGSGLAALSPIGTATMYLCRKLETITVPDGTPSLGTQAMYTCTSLKSYTNPKGGTAIAQDTFRNCGSLASVSLNPNITSIINNALTGTAIRDVTIPKNVTNIGQYAFSDCKQLQKASLPQGVTTCNSSLFYNDQVLGEVTIHGNLTSIGSSVFSTCYALQSIEIPSTATSIGSAAFYQVYGLTKVTVPASVSTISAQAFRYSSSITEYHFKRATPPSLSNTNAFQSINANCVMYVPYSEDHSILAAYQAASNWSTYASYMVEEAE